MRIRWYIKKFKQNNRFQQKRQTYDCTKKPAENPFEEACMSLPALTGAKHDFEAVFVLSVKKNCFVRKQEQKKGSGEDTKRHLKVFMNIKVNRNTMHMLK